MYTIIIKENFNAFHSVMLPCGTLEEPHKHNWQIEIGVKSEKLDKNGFAVEFLWLKDKLKDVVQVFEGKNLNETIFFTPNLPTAELVCKSVHDNLKKHLPKGVYMDYTLIEEAAGCLVKYTDL